VPDHAAEVALLESALATIPHPGSSNWAEVASRFVGVPREAVQSFVESMLIGPLVAATSNLDEFSAERSYTLRYPGGERTIDATLAATMLYRFVTGGGAMVDALRGLRRALGENETRGQFIMVVSGLNISSAADVTEDIRLLPFSDLPHSPSWNEASRHVAAAFLPPGIPAHLLPVAAFVARVTVPGTVRDGEGASPHVTVGAPSEVRAKLDEMRLACTCVGPSRPVPVVEWFEFSDPLLAQLQAPSGMAMVYEDLRHGYPWLEVQHDATEMAAVARRYSELADAGTRARLARALRRLNYAMRRADIGDRAVELSTALESVLVDDRGEHTFKIALRSALVIPGTRAERVAARAIVSAIYGIRSALVHSGQAATSVRVRGRGSVSAAEVVEEGSRITGAVLRELIRAGSIPQWEDLEVRQIVAK
jgi:hypothetical protein